MKKLFIPFLLLLAVSIFTTGVNAQTMSPDSYPEKITKTDVFTLKTLFQDNVVYIDWEKPNISDFKYYKIVRSTKNSNLVYPNDGYIGYLESNDTLEYTDKNPPNGLVYYRVCLVTRDDNIYCSKVSKVETNVERKEVLVCTMEYAPVCGKKDGVLITYGNKCMLTGNNATFVSTGECKKEEKVETPYTECVYRDTTTDQVYYAECKKQEEVKKTDISVTLKLKVQKTVKTFIQKLNNKKLTNDQKISAIDTVISRLEELKAKKASLSSIINYLIELLNEEKSKYSDDFNEIEEIFNLDL